MVVLTVEIRSTVSFSPVYSIVVPLWLLDFMNEKSKNSSASIFSPAKGMA